MGRAILIERERDRTRVAILEDGVLVEFYVEGDGGRRLAGNIYKGRVENVLPGMQAAFVDIGLDRNAYLYVADAAPCVGGEDEAAQRSGGRHQNAEELPIEQFVRTGEDIIVQIIKEPVGTKGARVTRQITLPGRFLVLLPGSDYIAISNRISSENERERLKKLVAGLRIEGTGFIVRTAGEGRTEEEFREDARQLGEAWEHIQSQARKVKAPALLHRDTGLVYRVLRDSLLPDISEITVDSPEEEREVSALLETFAPELKGKVTLQRVNGMSLFEARGIEEQLRRALARKVWLKNGAYIVFDHTEAMTVVDVNTGRYTGSTSLAETIFRTNTEAAREIARQLRLRDVGGIIVIDFIDMANQSHRDSVLTILEEELKKDRTKSTIVGLTGLGLVEMTRNKRRQSLIETLTNPCAHCNGSGRSRI